MQLELLRKRVRWFFGLTLLTFVVVRCGRDATLNITKVNTKKITVELTGSEAGVASVVASEHDGVLLNGDGSNQTEIPTGNDITLKANLEKGWEVVAWNVVAADDATVKKVTQDSLKLSEVKADQHVKLEIRRIPFLQFRVRVSGNGWMQTGGGSVNWKVFPPGATYWVDTGWCNTINGFSKEAPRVCDGTKKSDGTPSDKFPNGYPNGTLIEMELVGRKPGKEFGTNYTKKLEPFVLTDHYDQSFDFFPDSEK